MYVYTILYSIKCVITLYLKHIYTLIKKHFIAKNANYYLSLQWVIISLLVEGLTFNCMKCSIFEAHWNEATFKDHMHDCIVGTWEWPLVKAWHRRQMFSWQTISRQDVYSIIYMFVRHWLLIRLATLFDASKSVSCHIIKIPLHS